MRKTDVLSYYGNNAAAVARAIGYTRSAVHQWPQIIPEAAAYRVERATGGDLKVDPSLYQADLKQSA